MGAGYGSVTAPSWIAERILRMLSSAYGGNIAQSLKLSNPHKSLVALWTSLEIERRNCDIDLFLWNRSRTRLDYWDGRPRQGDEAVLRLWIVPDTVNVAVSFTLRHRQSHQ